MTFHRVILSPFIVLFAACSSASTPSSTTDAEASAEVAMPNDTGAPPADQPSSTDASAPPSDAAVVRRGHRSVVPMSLRPMDAARILVLGDSISAGVGASATALRYPNELSQNVTDRFPAAMGLDLATRFGHPVPVVNVAVGGATTATMRSGQIPISPSRLARPVAGHSIVVITVGGNDLQFAIATGANPAGSILDAAIGNLRTTVRWLQDPANLPDGVSIYLSTVYDPSDGEGHVEGCFFNLTLPQFVTALDTWRDRYEALGREMGFALIDSLGHFHGHGRNYQNMDNPYFDRADPTGWFSDCIHPNDRGHHELRRLFFEAIDGSYTVTP